MATIVMNMSGYEVEREVAVSEDYGDEVMCAGWNPQLALLERHPVPMAGGHISMPAELAEMDVDAFLQRMYSLSH